MPWTTIIKSRREWETVPNLHDYESIREQFTWEKARQDLEGLPRNQGLNIAHELLRSKSGGGSASPSANFDTAGIQRRLSAMQSAIDRAMAEQDKLF